MLSQCNIQILICIAFLIINKLYFFYSSIELSGWPTNSSRGRKVKRVISIQIYFSPQWTWHNVTDVTQLSGPIPERSALFLHLPPSHAKGGLHGEGRIGWLAATRWARCDKCQRLFPFYRNMSCNTDFPGDNLCITSHSCPPGWSEFWDLASGLTPFIIGAVKKWHEQ